MLRDFASTCIVTCVTFAISSVPLKAFHAKGNRSLDTLLLRRERLSGQLAYDDYYYFYYDLSAQGTSHISSSKHSLKIAVVGGGIAGATTVLELLSQKEGLDSEIEIEITLFEQADRIGHEKSASGISAAAMIFNAPEQYWKGASKDVRDIFDRAGKIRRAYGSFTIGDEGFDVDDLSKSRQVMKWAATMAAEKTSGNPKFDKEAQTTFFKEANTRLGEIVNKFPDICFAIAGPWCCKKGSAARKWMDARRGDGVSCEGIIGWSHAFFDKNDFVQANQKDEAQKLLFEIGALGTGIFQNVSKFFHAEGDLAGTLFNPNLGFARVEDIFPTFHKIFEQNGVLIRTGCLVESIAKGPSGKDLHLSLPNTCGDGVFNRVIVTAGANSIKVLAKHDKRLHEELLPVKGFAVATHLPLIPKEMLSLGCQHEEFSHYVRPQRNGGVRYGYGKVFGIPDHELLEPKYKTSWEDNDVAGIKLTKLGHEVLNSNPAKLAGIRPLSMYNNYPLLKEYSSTIPGVFLNTGYGWHGFVMSWKASQVIAHRALFENSDEHERYLSAVRSCTLFSIPCLPDWVLPTVLAVSIPTCIFFITCICTCYYRAKTMPSQEMRDRAAAADQARWDKAKAMAM